MDVVQLSVEKSGREVQTVYATLWMDLALKGIYHGECRESIGMTKISWVFKNLFVKRLLATKEFWGWHFCFDLANRLQ
jgi:hypothetical protein